MAGQVKPGEVRGGSVCVGCGRAFSSLSAFDRHQLGVGAQAEGNPVRCLDPAGRGLRLVSRSYGDVWSRPPPDSRGRR